MSFLQPSYLWGFLSLLVPIAIHLWSRNKVRTIKVGSTQFIAETKSTKSNSIRLNEWVLLLLRCLTLSLLVLILAKPHLSEVLPKKEITYIFERSLLQTENDLARFKNIPEEGRLLLENGFPEWKKNIKKNTATPPNYWQLAKNATTLRSDSVVIFTNAFAKAVKGKRPNLAAHINWIVVDDNHQLDTPIAAFKKRDSTEIIYAQMDAGNLTFRKEIQSNAIEELKDDSLTIETSGIKKNIPFYRQAPIRVTILSDASTHAELYYLKSAFRAIGNYVNREILIENPTALDTLKIMNSNYLITLIDTNFTNPKTPTLELRPDFIAKNLIEPSAKNQIYNLTKALTPKVVIEENFVASLLDWMQLYEPLENSIRSVDQRKLSENQIHTNYIASKSNTKRIIKADMSNFLWIVLLVILIAERMVSRMRKQ